MAMPKPKPRLALAVADLLPPVRDQARTVVVPHERGGCESDPPTAVLKPPAHIHVIAGAKKDGIEAADGQQRLATRGEIAARNVLRLAVVEHHMAWRTWRTRHALRKP